MTLKSFTHPILHLSITISLLFVGGFGFFNFLKINHLSLLSVETAPLSVLISGRLNEPLLKNDSIKVEFTNPLPHLGIVSLRFLTFSRINADSLIFSLKQNGEKQWSYSNIYKTDQFQPGQLFPFGFPEIIASENKTFTLEIISQSGTPSSAIALSGLSPVITTRQVFTLGELKRHPSLFARFLANKLNNILSDVRTVNQLLISFLPLLVYLAIYPRIKNKFALFTIILFLILMVIGSSAPGTVIESVSAVTVVSCVILTAYYFWKIIRFKNKHGPRSR